MNQIKLNQFIDNHSLSAGIFVAFIASVVRPINYIGLATLVLLYVYREESRRLDSKQLSQVQSLGEAQTLKLNNLETEFKELKSQLSLSKLGGNWPK